MVWKFDESVAERFQHEAQSHIPDYDRVIDLCLNYAEWRHRKDDIIVDVGSALGHTLHIFHQAGYTNIHGIESSIDMINRSLHSDKVIHSSSYVDLNPNLVLMNWTLHFIPDKKSYLRSIYDDLAENGSLILTDKTVQSLAVRSMYYNFKYKRGVPYQYIFEKENELKDVMYLDSVDWYFKVLSEIGFKVEILNAKYGFVTFVGVKDAN